MSKEKSDDAVNANISGTIIAPAVIQVGNNLTNIQTPSTSILNWLMQNWPYLTSAVGSAGGIWALYAYCVDWIIPTLLWGTSTATICLVIREHRTRRQIKEKEKEELEAQECEARRRQFFSLSDSACELIVAALNAGDDQIHVRRNCLFVSPLQNTRVFQSDVPPEERPNHAVVLDELVQKKLLIPCDGIYYVDDFAKKNKAELVERDNARLVKMFDNAGKQIFRNAPSRDHLILCQLKEDESSDYRLEIFDPIAARRVDMLSPFTRQELFDTVRLLTKNGLVEYWNPATFTNNASQVEISKIKINYSIFQNEGNANFGALLENSWNGVAGRLTERGLQIARIYQKQSKRP